MGWVLPQKKRNEAECIELGERGGAPREHLGCMHEGRRGCRLASTAGAALQWDARGAHAARGGGDRTESNEQWVVGGGGVAEYDWQARRAASSTHFARGEAAVSCVTRRRSHSRNWRDPWGLTVQGHIHLEESENIQFFLRNGAGGVLCRPQRIGGNPWRELTQVGKVSAGVRRSSEFLVGSIRCPLKRNWCEPRPSAENHN